MIEEWRETRDENGCKERMKGKRKQSEEEQRAGQWKKKSLGGRCLMHLGLCCSDFSRCSDVDRHPSNEMRDSEPCTEFGNGAICIDLNAHGSTKVMEETLVETKCDGPNQTNKRIKSKKQSAAWRMQVALGKTQRRDREGGRFTVRAAAAPPPPAVLRKKQRQTDHFRPIDRPKQTGKKVNK